MGWNPLESAAFTGAGTPWGAPDKGNPAKPNYVTDPNAMPGYDYAPMQKAMEQSLREKRARTDQTSRSGLLAANPYGGGQGSSASRAYGQSAANTEAAINEGSAALAKQGYDEKVAAMKSANDALRAEYDAALKAKQREEDQRAGFVNRGINMNTAGLSGS